MSRLLFLGYFLVIIVFNCLSQNEIYTPQVALSYIPNLSPVLTSAKFDTLVKKHHIKNISSHSISSKRAKQYSHYSYDSLGQFESLLNFTVGKKDTSFLFVFTKKNKNNLITHLYNSYPKDKKELEEIISNKKLKYTSLTLFKYNSQKQLIQVSFLNKDSIYSTIHYDYNKQNTLIKSTLYTFTEQDTFISKNNWLYHQNKLIEYKHYQDNIFVYKQTFFYQSDTILMRQYSRPKAKKVILFEKNIYNKKKQLISTINQHNDAFTSTIINYSYYPFGLIKSSTEQFKNSLRTIRSTQKYYYTAKNKLLKKISSTHIYIQKNLAKKTKKNNIVWKYKKGLPILVYYQGNKDYTKEYFAYKFY